MAEIKLNKTELKAQKNQLDQLTKYLPTLQLKKQQLQAEVENLKNSVARLSDELEMQKKKLQSYSLLFSELLTVDLRQLILIENVEVETENIAGVEVPVFRNVIFKKGEYSFFILPLWVDKAADDLRSLISMREKLKIADQRLMLIQEELRQTNIKVNLFEKRMIPKCKENIKKIKIFLGDQEIAAICNAKIAKDKLKRKELVTAEA
ncbi:MAG: V-type ATP synthase subunit D [Spirochaetes bacterium]|nr:V-type ATP synthase subunit D [Spirochaetota bacterium]